jgi:hypothetical protein
MPAVRYLEAIIWCRAALRINGRDSAGLRVQLDGQREGNVGCC